MATITMSSNTDVYLNETIIPTIFNTLIMDKNLSTSTTLIESSSLDDLCKNFHVSFSLIINWK
jgi:hypothetical protein